MSNAERQLLELEALESMYPSSDEFSQFSVNPASLARLRLLAQEVDNADRADNASRINTGGSSSTSCTLTLKVRSGSQSASATLHIMLPWEYPSDAMASVSLVSGVLSNASTTELNEGIAGIARACNGAESLFQVAMEAESTLQQMLERRDAEASAASNSARQAARAIATNVESRVLLFIDHMNDHTTYLKKVYRN